LNKVLVYLFIGFLIPSGGKLFSQNEGKKWYFGNQAGLDFMTTPPTVLTNGAMNCSEGSASIADGAGNLLFYTDGITIYNASHVAMTGGTNMAGSGNATQSSVIVKQPGNSTIYYVFLVAGNGGSLYYSKVDMSQSAGLGAVTVSNVIINTVNTEKLTATKHCNGTDVWIVTHDWGNNHFLAYLLTSTGLSSAVMSAVGTTHNGSGNNVLGCMKISPTGKKLGLAIWATINTFEIYDFDNSTGAVSNPLILGTNYTTAYGCEFSPDGSKFYGSREVGSSSPALYQWDLCAGSSTAIIASEFTIAPLSSTTRNNLQVGPDGKIYVARNTQSFLGVINSPNLQGSACNYTDTGQSLGTQSSTRGLPNFISSFFKQAPQPITYTINPTTSCFTATFGCTSITTNSVVGCGSVGFSVTGFYWKFGDPPSGSSNTSTAVNPVHLYPATGSYTAQLFLTYSCGGGVDSTSGLVVINIPTVSVSSATGTCNGLGSATVNTSSGAGNYSYSWTPSAPNSSVVNNMTPGTYTLTVTDNAGCRATITTNIATPVNLSPVLVISNATTCPFAVGNLSATGATSYTWNPSGFAGSTFSASPGSTSVYSVVGASLSCTATTTTSIVVKSPPVATLTVNTPVCSGQSLQLGATGGTTYAWSGPQSFTSALQNPTIGVMSISNAGNYSLTLTGANSCTATTSISVSVNSSPTISVPGVTVCTSQTLNLSVNAANGSTFYWSGPNSFTSSLQNPSVVNPGTVVTGVYQVTVTDVSTCKNTATTNVLVLTPPNPTIIATSALCEGSDLTFTANGGNTYVWNGPNSFFSNVQSPTIYTCTIPAAGDYTLTASNGYCNGVVVKTITVYPLPTLTLTSNSPVCETKSLALQVNTGSAVASYHWKGPAFFSDTLQSTGRDSSKASYSGIYSVTITDYNNCNLTATQSITILYNPLLSVTGATVCLHEKAVLKASGAVNYTWTEPGSQHYSGSGVTIFNVWNLTPLQYTVVGTSTNNCSVEGYANLIALPLPVPSMSVSNTKACTGATINLQGFGGDFYEWSGPGNFRDYNGNVTFVASNIGNSGTFSLTVIDKNGCKSFTTTEITINPIPTGNLTGPDKGCSPFCTTFKFNPVGNVPVVTYEWQIGNTSFSGATLKYCFQDPGNFILYAKFTDTNNCASSHSVMITVLTSPKANFSYQPQNPVENLESVIFTNTSEGEGINQWTWYFSDNENKISARDCKFLFREAGSYPVALVIKNNYDCADTILRVINVETDFNLFVPNVFSPNDDDLNEVFMPVARGVKLYHLSVFDRWGNEVFESSEVSLGWDGTYNGAPCKADTYAWKINATANNGAVKNLVGHIILTR
jgi:gliding motility-associated-like protein